MNKHGLEPDSIFAAKKSARSWPLVLSALLPLAWNAPVLALDNVDLSSTQPDNIAAKTVTIRAGGKAQTVSPGTMLTDSQMAAVQQVMNTGRQQLTVGASGNATGGRLNLGTDVVGGINNLFIPKGVTAVNDFGKFNAVNVMGSLTNAGKLVAYTSNAAVTQNLINAQSLTNLQTGLITNSLSGTGVVGIAKAMNLNFNVLNDFVNQGTIRSTGGLSITAGGSIMNLTPATQSAPAMIMAAKDITLASSSITNTGTIQSIRGNINVASPLATDLTFSNIGGTVRAANGMINFRDANFLLKEDLQLLGGDFLAKAINFYSGDGTVNVDVAKIIGRVNVYGGIAHVTAASPSLHLGDIVLTGDPTFYNTAGDVVIDGNFIFSGQDLAIVAGGNILSGSNGGQISTGQVAGKGGQINLIAGAQFTSTGPAFVLPATGDTTSTITITGGSTIGGKIDLTVGTPITSVSSATTGGNSGDINIVAFKGTNLNSGTIKLPNTGAASINASVNTGNAGNITVLAGASSGKSIQLGQVSAQLLTNNTPGTILIATKTPELGSGVTILNGKITSGAFTPGALQGASLSTNTILATASNVTIESGANVAITSGVNVSAGFPTGAGSLSVSSASSSPLVIGSATGSNFIQLVVANAVSGNGANLSFSNSGSGGISVTKTLSADAAVSGAGGSLVFDATSNGGTGTVTFGANSYTARGVNGNGGSITVKSTNAPTSTSFTLTQLLVGLNSGSGNGGNISFTTTSPTADILANSATFHHFQFFANGGPNGGNGGTITLNAGRDILINTGLGLVSASPGGGTGGEGGNFSLTAGRNVSVTGSINASANASTFKGGSVFISTTSSSPFQTFGVAPVNGTTSGITAQGINATSGSITILNKGSGGIVHNSSAGLNILPGGLGGKGGTIILDATQGGGTGSIVLGSAVVVSANGFGAGANDGGSVALRGSSILAQGAAPTIQANGTNTGKGGQVEITSTDPGASIGISGNSGTFQLSARAATGKGGSITINSGQDIIINPAQLNVAPTVSGSGGDITLNAGRNVNILSGSINAGAQASGNGGSITITTKSSTPFTIGLNASPNGIFGTLIANAAVSGNGGSISVSNSGSGGIVYTNNVFDLSFAPAGNGNGGSVTLDASSNGGSGTVTMGNFTLNATPSGTGSTAGNLTVKGTSIVTPGIVLQANGVTTGAGGKVTVETTNPAFDLTVGQASLVGINVAGGTTSGNAGEVSVNSARDLTVAPGASFNTQVFSGNGAKVSLSAGRNLDVNAGLNVNAAGTGNGGSVSLNSNSSTIFTVGGGATNRINGNISAIAATNGSQGSISVVNSGSGGINLSAVLLNASGAGTAGNVPGSITLSGSTLTGSGGVAINGGKDGVGGNISITTTNSTADIVVPAIVAMSANGGTTSGDGGSITLKAGQDLIIADAAQVAVTPTNGSGGHLILEAGRNVAISNNNLFAGSNALGSGGSIRIVSNSPSMFFIGSNSGPNFVQNTMNAKGAGATGDGGSIEIVNRGSGGISHQNNGAFTNILPGANGKGGSLTLDAAASGGNGPIFLGSNSALFTINSDGTGTGDGGNITISGDSISLPLLFTTLSAQGNNGGTVSVTTTGVNSNIAVQQALGLTIDVDGAVNAGKVILSAGHNISFNTFQYSANAASGDGATVSLTAGTGGWGNVQILGSSLLATGGGNGNGGQIDISFRDSLGGFSVGNASGDSFAVGLNASGAGKGTGGSISINNTAGTGLDLQLTGSTLSAKGSTTGILSLLQPASPVSINSNSGSIDALVNASGSTFTYVSNANSNSLLLNDIQMTGAIGISNSGTGTTVSVAPGGKLTTTGGNISIATNNLINSGSISASGFVQITGATGLTISGLGHMQSDTSSVSFLSFADILFAGSQTYSAANDNFVFVQPGNTGTISLNPGVTMNIISDSNFQVTSSASFKLGRSSSIISQGGSDKQLSFFGASNVLVEDGFNSTFSSAGAPITFFSNSSTINFSSFTGTTIGRLTITGAESFVYAKVLNTTVFSSIVVDQPISLVTPSLTHNGQITTFASGNSIIVEGASGKLQLDGAGNFSPVGILPLTLSFTEPAGITLSNGLAYTVIGTNASAIFDAPSITVLGNPGNVSLFSTNGISFSNSQAPGNLSFATAGTATINFTGGDVTTSGGSLTIPINFTLSHNGGGRFHFNIPAGGSINSNGSVISAATGGNGIEILGAGALTLSGNGSYFCNGTDLLNINSTGSLTILGQLNASSSAVIQTTAASNIDGSLAVFSSPGKTLTVKAGSGTVNLNTTVGTVALTGTGDISIFNGSNLSLSSLTGTPNSLILDANGTLDINGAINATDLFLTSSGKMTLAQNVTGSKSVTLTVFGTSNIGGAGTVSGGLLTIGAGSGTILLSTAVSDLALNLGGSSTATINQSGNLSLASNSAAGDLTINAINAGDNLVFDSNLNASNLSLVTTGTGSITGKGLLTVGSNLIISVDNGPVDLNTSTKTLILASAGAVAINESDAIILDGVNAASFDLKAVTVTNSSPLTVNGLLNIQTSALTNNDAIVTDTTVVSSADGLLIDGTGTFDSTFTVNLTAAANNLSFAGSQTIFGVANLNAVNPGQSVFVQNGVTVTGNNLVNVNSPSLVLQGSGTITGNPLRINSVTGAGTIANASGDVVLPANLIFDGKNLSILASGNIMAASAAKSITLSSKTLAGGNLFIAAGFDFTPAPFPAAPGFSTQTFTLGSASATGGSVLLPLLTINTSTTAANKTGGNVTVLANAGPENAGAISLGAITTSASNSRAGDITLIGQGGVQTGKITATGGNAGNVTISGSQLAIIGGSVQITNGTVLGTGLIQTGSLNSGAGAAIFVNGAILANSLTGSGGNVNLEGDAQIETAGNILTSGATGGGAVDIFSLDSYVSIGKGGINTSGLQITSAATAGTAGGVFIVGPAGITVNGSLLASGGSNKGTGNAGAGGFVSLQTTDNNPSNLFINNTKIAGLLDTRGGSALGGGSGAAGGNVSIFTGTLQVTQANISINASAGTGAGAPANGSVAITTYASQAFPASFDLTSSKKSLPALPGGMFTTGIASPVNGTAGNIVSGTSVASKANASRIVAGPGFVSPNVNILVNGGGQTITENKTAVPISPDNGSGVRTLVTPSEAVALFQKSLTGTQTIQLNQTGQTETTSVIDVQSFELPQAFTAFSLKAVNAPTNDVKLNVAGARPIITLPAAGVVLQGVLEFTGAVGMLDFGKGAVTLPANSIVKGDTVIISSSSANWLAAGLIQADRIVLSHPATAALVLTVPAGGDITGSLGSSLFLSPGFMPTFGASFKVTGGDIEVPFEFGQIAVPTTYKTSALNHASTASALRPVALTFAMFSATNDPIQAVVQGTPYKASTISISTLSSKVGQTTISTPLLIDDNTVLNANSTLKISSAGTLSIGDDVDITAGVLKSTAAPTGLLNATDISKAGSITISAPTINIGSDGSMVVNGGKLNVTATTGNLTMGDNGNYQSNGVSVSILALGTVTGGTGNNFYARGLNVKNNAGGTIEVGSGLTKPDSFANAFKNPRGTVPPSGTLGSGVVITNGGSGVVATNITGGFVNLRTGGVAPANLNLTGGAILFEALGTGSGKSVQFDGVIMKTESLKLIGYTETAPVEDDENYKDQPANIALRAGRTFLRIQHDTIIHTGFAIIHAKKGALLCLHKDSEILRVIACSGPGDLQMNVEGSKVDLPPGTEVLISDQLNEEDLLPADGVGRRNCTQQALPSGKTLAIQSVSLISLLSNSKDLEAIRNPQTEHARKLHSQFLKTAAALHQVEGNKGPFRGRSPEKPSPLRKEEFLPVAHSSR